MVDASPAFPLFAFVLWTGERFDGDSPSRCGRPRGFVGRPWPGSVDRRVEKTNHFRLGWAKGTPVLGRQHKWRRLPARAASCRRGVRLGGCGVRREFIAAAGEAVLLETEIAEALFVSLGGVEIEQGDVFVFELISEGDAAGCEGGVFESGDAADAPGVVGDGLD